MLTPTSVAEVQDAVRQLDQVVATGRGTKSAMSAGANLSLAGMAGVLEYDPSEFTFTASAGTTLATVRDLLRDSGQYLPFDPPLVDAGGTLGGTIASGLSGAGRFRYGGVRDFLLGLTFVTGDGEVRHGGGKVVKNAAGFDFPKLMVGARGTLGIICEVTFKVFPEPKQYKSIVVDLESLDEAPTLMERLAMSNMELACLDFVPPGRLLLRVGGLESSLPKRVESIRTFLGKPCEVLGDAQDEKIWKDAREFVWLPKDATLVKVAINPRQIVDIETEMLSSVGSDVSRRYSVGGNVVWLGWPNELGAGPLAQFLSKLDRAGVAVIGEPWGMLGPRRGEVFLKRIASVLDPTGKLRRPESATVA